MDSLRQDLRFAVRSLLKSPAFTAIAVLTLGLGIGANAAIFSVIDATLLRPLPYAEPGNLVAINHHYPELGLDAPVSVPGFHDYSRQSGVFAHAAVETGWAPNLTGDGDPERLTAVQVSGDYFPTYGVAPALGRGLRQDETEAGREKVVVLSDGFWRRKLGADPAAVGRSLQLNGESYEIVGVMPPGFRDFFTRSVELWAPLVFQPAQFNPNNYTNEFLNFTGRLRPGETPAQAQRDMTAFAEQLKTTYPNQFTAHWGLRVLTLETLATQNVRTALYVLMAAVGFVLLIACANVANLQLARASARARELAVRVALGASPRRLIRGMMTESVVIALAGGAVGVLLALWAVPALLALDNRGLPPASEIGVNGTVLAFTFAVALLTGLAFGILPAWRMSRADIHGALKEGGRGASGDRAGLALRRGLVVATIAIALTLLTGAGLLIRSFSRVLAVDPGFEPDHLLTFNLSLPASRYPNDTLRTAAFDRVLEAVRAVPGVRSAGAATIMPFSGNFGTASFNVEGYTPPPNTPSPWGDVRAVTPGFFQTIGARLLRGRDFTDADGPGAPTVAIVDEDLANRYWKGEDPIGKRITFNSLTDSSIAWITVVGEVRHTMQDALDGQRRVQYYFPARQIVRPFLTLGVRTAGDPMAALGAVRAAVRSVDPDLPIANPSDMESLIESTTGPRRFAMVLLAGFAGLALTLASIGLYGVMSFVVTQRERELGVRMALGAATRDVLGLVLGQGVRLALGGVLIGLAAAFAVTRVMKGMLFEVSATDPVTFAAIALLLVGVAALASYLPARRAMRVDPIEALRAE